MIRCGTIGNGQLQTTLLGKMLRIDVEGRTGATPYAIPAGNPYAGNARCNVTGTARRTAPRSTPMASAIPGAGASIAAAGQLWLNDVGQGALEEVDLVVRGGNYGWRCFEGTQAFHALADRTRASSLPPWRSTSQAQGFSTTGGFVYRGAAIPALDGRYVFGDFGRPPLAHRARHPPTRTGWPRAYATGLSIASFGAGIDGRAVHGATTAATRLPLRAAYRRWRRQIPTQLSQRAA